MVGRYPLQRQVPRRCGVTAAYAPSDRCDSCGARAKVEVLLSSGASLLLCGHHLNDHESKLAEAFAVIMPLAVAR